MTGDIKWINRPYLCKVWLDKYVHDGMKFCLNEWVEAEDRYIVTLGCKSVWCNFVTCFGGDMCIAEVSAEKE